MGLNLPFGIAPTVAIPNIDERYGTYSAGTVLGINKTPHQMACLNVPLAVRKLGLTVGIIENNSVVEYWWKSGTLDTDLIVKSISGKIPLRHISDIILASEEYQDYSFFPITEQSTSVLYVALNTLDNGTYADAGGYLWDGSDYIFQTESMLKKIIDLQTGLDVFSDWSKAMNKPTYTAAEVGASPVTLNIFLQGNGNYFPLIFKYPLAKTVSSVQRMSNCSELKVTISGTQYTINNSTPNALNNKQLSANTELTIDSITPATGSTAANALIIF